MSIRSLSVHGFRNIKDTTFELGGGLNWVYGSNGSGKTSLLEALYFLTTGRSFRTRHLKYLFANDQERESFVLHGATQCREERTEIGIRKSKHDNGLIKMNGRVISAASDLVVINPTTIIQPSSFDLLYGSPKIRRQFFDWGVFHVEHQFRDTWRLYNSCLKQRNSLLRTARIDRLEIKYWDNKLAQYGERVAALREQYLGVFENQLKGYLQSLLADHVIVEEIDFSIKRGWDKSKSLEQVLSEQFEKDIERKFTQYGPHRFDFSITIEKKPADQWFSRGQQKLLIVALYLAQVSRVKMADSTSSVSVLLDDITSELDSKSVSALISSLLRCECQVVVTTLQSPDQLPDFPWGQKKVTMFHVEHGDFNKQDYCL